MGDYFQHCSISVGKKSHLKPTDAEQDGGLFSTLFHVGSMSQEKSHLKATYTEQDGSLLLTVSHLRLQHVPLVLFCSVPSQTLTHPLKS